METLDACLGGSRPGSCIVRNFKIRGYAYDPDASVHVPMLTFKSCLRFVLPHQGNVYRMEAGLKTSSNSCLSYTRQITRGLIYSLFNVSEEGSRQGV